MLLDTLWWFLVGNAIVLDFFCIYMMQQLFYNTFDKLQHKISEELYNYCVTFCRNDWTGKREELVLTFINKKCYITVMYACPPLLKIAKKSPKIVKITNMSPLLKIAKISKITQTNLLIYPKNHGNKPKLAKMVKIIKQKLHNKLVKHDKRLFKVDSFWRWQMATCDKWW